MKKREDNMKSSLVCFFLDCLEQLEQRLPRNKAIFQGLTFLSSSVSPNHVGSKVPFVQLPMAHLRNNNADANGNAPFQDLALNTLACLKTPVPIASVERVFSNMAYFKKKLNFHHESGIPN